MRRLVFLGVITGALALFLVGPAHADDYAGGTPPKAGSVAPGTHVLGEHYTNTAWSETQGPQEVVASFATTGADIAELVGIAFVAIAVGFVMVRRSRARSAPPAV